MTTKRSRVGGDSAKNVPRRPPVRVLSPAELATAQRCADDIARILIEFARVLVSQLEANELAAQET